VRAKLNEVCSVFGLPRKFGINGSKVSKMIYQGKVEEVRDYCETDVLNTNLVYLRLMMHRGGIDLDGYNRSI
jgi:predicted PolB exonuclease-like 3'-5' exonuclease